MPSRAAPTTTTSRNLSPDERRGFALARSAARQVLERRTRVLRLAGSAYRKASRHDNALEQVREDLGSLVRLARAWAKRRYRDVPWSTMLYVAAALVYFVNPVDVIPDALLGVGLVDDVAVIAAVVHGIRNDLDRFRSWEAETAVDLAS